MPLNPRAHHSPTLHPTLRTHHRALHPPPLHGIVAAEASCAEGVGRADHHVTCGGVQGNDEHALIHPHTMPPPPLSHPTPTGHLLLRRHRVLRVVTC